MEKLKEVISIMDTIRITSKKLRNKHKMPFRRIEFQALLTIMEVDEATNITMQELGEELGITKPRVTAIVSNLIRKDFVSCSTDSRDRRKKILTLTTQGEDYMTQHKIQHEKEFKQMWDKFTDEEQEHWIHLLSKTNSILLEKVDEQEQ